MAIVVIVYLAALVISLLSQFVVPPDYADFTRSLFSLGLFLSFVLLPLCLLLRHRRLSLLLLLAVAAWLILYAPLLLPRFDPAAPGGTETTILTFNIQAPTEALESISSIIEDADADMVGIQELSAEAAAHFEQTLQDRYPYMALYPQDNPHVGQGVLSRYPIAAENYWRNEQLDATLGHLRVELDINGTSVALYNTHPVPPFSFEQGRNLRPHSRELGEVLDRAEAETIPTLIVGDFNMTDQFGEYYRITENFTDTYLEAGGGSLGFTFPNGQRLPFPRLIRLDYIFHSAGFEGLEARVWERSGSSDHLPVFARLVLYP